MARKKWSELSVPQRCALGAAALLQLALAGTAWFDLSRRPAAAVRGPKGAWAAAIGVNIVGPVAYLRFGRRQTPPVRDLASPVE